MSDEKRDFSRNFYQYLISPSSYLINSRHSSIIDLNSVVLENLLCCKRLAGSKLILKIERSDGKLFLVRL